MFGDRHAIVIFTVIAETAEVSGFLATMTVVTLMTLIYGLILDEGMRLYFVGSLRASTEADEPDAQCKEPLTYAIIEATSGVGFV
jgi:hypothetical protein